MLMCELKYDREKQVTGLTSKLAFEIEGRLVRELDLINNDLTLIGRSPKDGITDIGLANPTLFSTTPKFYEYHGCINYWNWLSAFRPLRV